MVSIIVSSYNEKFFTQFEKSVAETIGVVYEIVKVPNPGLFGICEAYNQGAAQAKYKYLCFCHEDILFNTVGWGTAIIKAFNSESDIGLIGVAGSAYQSWVPSGWNATQDKLKGYNLVHQDRTTRHQNKIFLKHDEETLMQVVAVDGCFMFTSRKVFKSYQFDSATFQNYHCYDVDFSLQVNQSFKVCITYNVLLTHLSGGNFDKKWLTETLSFYKKWRKTFPLSARPVTQQDIRLEEEGAFYRLVDSVFNIRAGYLQLLKTYFHPRFMYLAGIKKWLYIPYISAKIIYIKLRYRQKIK